MYKEHKVEKLFYSIGEVAAMFNVNPSLIRYWEGEFSILKPKKSAKGTRYYTQKDISNLRLIYYYAKERGMTLKGVKAKLKENKDDAQNNFEVVQKLQSVRDTLLQISKFINESPT